MTTTTKTFEGHSLCGVAFQLTKTQREANIIQYFYDNGVEVNVNDIWPYGNCIGISTSGVFDYYHSESNQGEYTIHQLPVCYTLPGFKLTGLSRDEISQINKIIAQSCEALFIKRMKLYEYGKLKYHTQSARMILLYIAEKMGNDLPVKELSALVTGNYDDRAKKYLIEARKYYSQKEGFRIAYNKYKKKMDDFGSQTIYIKCICESIDKSKGSQMYYIDTDLNRVECSEADFEKIFTRWLVNPHANKRVLHEKNLLEMYVTAGHIQYKKKTANS